MNRQQTSFLRDSERLRMAELLEQEAGRIRAGIGYEQASGLATEQLQELAFVRGPHPGDDPLHGEIARDRVTVAGLETSRRVGHITARPRLYQRSITLEPHEVGDSLTLRFQHHIDESGACSFAGWQDDEITQRGVRQYPATAHTLERFLAHWRDDFQRPASDLSRDKGTALERVLAQQVVDERRQARQTDNAPDGAAPGL